MIEQVYKANMKISMYNHYINKCVHSAHCKTLGSTFEPAGNGNIRMSLIIDNGTQLPATSMTGVLEFKAKEVYRLNKYYNDSSYLQKAYLD